MISGYRSTAASMTRGPVDARQTQIGDDDVEGELGQRLERRLAAFGLDHLVSVIRQTLGHGRSQRRLVFDEQQMFRSISHLCGASTF